MDSMLIMLFLGLLALPILTIGMTGYKNSTEVLGVEAADESDPLVDDFEEEETAVEIKTFKVRVVGSGPGETTESTQSVRGFQAVPRMTDDF